MAPQVAVWGVNRWNDGSVWGPAKPEQKVHHMSHVDPDAFHGAVDGLITHVTNNAAAITAGGADPTLIKTKLGTVRDTLAGDKGIRDQKKVELAVAQQAFVESAGENYAGFSSIVDTVSGALGKTTPAGKQALAYRSHLNAAPQHHASPAPAPTPPTP
jgi:methionine synthase I (cobalamin-dependent)